mgnify:FL=1
MKLAARLSLAVLLVAFLLAPFLVHPGLVFIAGFAMIQIVFALSWNLLFSYAGLVAFGHAAFFGIGAYVSAVALRYGWHINFLLIPPISAVLGAAAAFLVAIVVLRRANGIQFSVLTLALSQLVVVLIGYSEYLGHDEGISAIPRPVINLGIATLDLNNPLASYYFVIVIGLIAIALIWLVVHGPIGRTMQAVRIDPERAAFVGIDVWRLRVVAFTLSGGFAALAGSLLAPWAQIVHPDYVNWLASAQPLFATLLGGAGFFWGPVVGVLGLAWLNYAMRTFVGLSEIMIGASLLVVVLLAPQGILGALRDAVRRRRGKVAGEHR